MPEGYPGSYPGLVADDADPTEQHRLRVLVPAIFGDESRWAVPSVAPDGSDHSTLPAIGDQVSVSFERGQTDYPVWSAGVPDPTPATSGYIGKYRGVVVDDADPLQQHRVNVQIPEILVEAIWARAAEELGTDIHVPSVGTAVWIEFEAGDPNYPNWVGLA